MTNMCTFKDEMKIYLFATLPKASRTLPIIEKNQTSTKT